MDYETPRKELIASLARSRPNYAYITNLLRISTTELRRLIALYWPDLHPPSLENLHKSLGPRRLKCNIRIALPEDPCAGEPGEPIIIPEITEPI